MSLLLESGLWLPTSALPTGNTIEAQGLTSRNPAQFSPGVSVCDLPAEPGWWVTTDSFGSGTVMSTNPGGSVVVVAMCNGEDRSWPCDALTYVLGGC
jgi:hypothetical protein